VRAVLGFSKLEIAKFIIVLAAVVPFKKPLVKVTIRLAGSYVHSRAEDTAYRLLITGNTVRVVVQGRVVVPDGTVISLGIPT
jgi:hypothetical protein